MKSKNLGLQLAGTIFGLVAIAHIIRLVTGCPVSICEWLLPIWINVMGAIACGFLSWWLWKLSFQK